MHGPWYDDRAQGLGSEFVRAVDVAASAVLRFPLAFPEVHQGVRKVVLRRFPCSLLYVVEDDAVVVLACFHHRREPKSWDERA